MVGDGTLDPFLAKVDQEIKNKKGKFKKSFKRERLVLFWNFTNVTILSIVDAKMQYLWFIGFDFCLVGFFLLGIEYGEDLLFS